MIARATRIMIVTGIAALLAAGCANGQSGTAVSALSDGVGTNGPTPAGSAPAVPVPLSVAKLTGSPCSLLDAAQLRAIGLTAAATAQRDESAVMVGCEWNDRTVGVGTQVDVDLITPLHHGMTDIYVQRGSAAYWQPLVIDGYPAVLTDTVDERGSGTCGLDLGATNSDVIDIAYQGIGSSQPCQKVQALASAVVMSLKGDS